MISVKENLAEVLEPMIFARAGVPFVEGEPGVGKSAIIASIAKKHGMQFFDERLSDRDSSEIAGIPDRGIMDGIRVTEILHPKWAVKANQAPSIVFFDEVNHASLENRRASQQIFNERKLGDIKFNDDVYFVCAGNLGDGDGTEVEDFDTALWNRLLYVRYEPTAQEWLKWAVVNGVNKFVTDFIAVRPESLMTRKSKGEDKVFGTFRSWTNFSKFLNYFGEDSKNLKFVLSKAQEYIFSYVGGKAGIGFIKWAEEQTFISLDHILSSFKSVEDTIKRLDRSKKSELISEMKGKKYLALKKQQYVNLVEFLKICEEDEVVGYFTHVISEEVDSDVNGGIPAPVKYMATEMPFIKTRLTELYKKEKEEADKAK